MGCNNLYHLCSQKSLMFVNNKQYHAFTCFRGLPVFVFGEVLLAGKLIFIWSLLLSTRTKINMGKMWKKRFRKIWEAKNYQNVKVLKKMQILEHHFLMHFTMETENNIFFILSQWCTFPTSLMWCNNCLCMFTRIF